MSRAERLFALSILASALVAGCSSDTEQPATVNPTSGTPTTPTGPVGGASAGSVSTVPVGAAGAPGVGAKPPTMAPMAPITPPTTGGTTTQPGAQAGVPCDVAKLVSDRCTMCHATKPQGGAPMPLMTLADFQAPAKSNPQMTVAQIVPSRVNAMEQARLMPPVGSVAALMPAERATISDWATAGAKGVTTNACAITEPSKTGEGEGMMPTGGVTNVMPGTASLEPIDYMDPDMKCYKFLTHAQGDFDKPYSHGPGEEYVNFSFKAPWTGTVYTRAHKLAIGDAPILHHWLLYVDQNPGRDGGIQGGSTGIHPSSNLLHAWAPGASPLYFAPDVGMKLTDTIGLTLEAHINNATGSTGQDHNGAEICVTSKVPAHVVDMTWTGSESIVGTSAQGTCTPRSQMPIHIIAAQPHMHKKGTHMKVVVNRMGGMKEVIHDEDFNFDNQRYYIEDTVLMPGDTFTVSCSYSAPATFGQSTNNEMCYWFPIAWPSGAMASGAGIHGPTTCLR